MQGEKWHCFFHFHHIYADIPELQYIEDTCVPMFASIFSLCNTFG